MTVSAPFQISCNNTLVTHFLCSIKRMGRPLEIVVGTLPLPVFELILPDNLLGITSKWFAFYFYFFFQNSKKNWP
jgi:hypothetical protein